MRDESRARGSAPEGRTEDPTRISSYARAPMAKERAAKAREHDAIVRVLARALSGRDRVKVEPASQAEPGGMPDVVLRDPRTHRLLRVLAVETHGSLVRPSPERWELFASFAPLTLIVPKGAACTVERLLLRTDARIVEYEHTQDDEVVFRPGI